MLLFKPISLNLTTVESFRIIDLDLSISGRILETFDLISIDAIDLNIEYDYTTAGFFIS